jgi:putative ABC transport system permease protein
MINKILSAFKTIQSPLPLGGVGGGFHVFALIREDKLFSAIYIAGTAVAIASAMVIAIVFHIKLGDIPPESHRSRTLYVINSFATESAKRNNSGFPAGVSTMAIDSVFRQMKSVELATGLQSASWNNFIIADEQQEHIVNAAAMACDPDFFRLYDLDFISGRPFSEKEFCDGEPVCVVSENIAKQLGGVDHFVIYDRNNLPPLRIVGVVKTVSALMENTAADLYISYKAKDVLAFNPDDFGIEQIAYCGGLQVCVLLRDGYSREDFLKELEPLRKHYNAVASQQVGEGVEWVVSAEKHFFKNMHFFGDLDDQTLVNQAKNLMPPAILMLLFLFLPAINLSGLVSNRMEARRAEMGIRKAFGGKRRTLLNEVVNENLVLTLLGGAVGWVLSWVFISAVSESQIFVDIFQATSLPNRQMSLDFRMFFTPTLFLIAFVCCAVLNLMAALLPAWHSLRKPIVESLNQKR